MKKVEINGAHHWGVTVKRGDKYLHSDGKWRDSLYNQEMSMTGIFVDKEQAEKCLETASPVKIPIRELQRGNKFRENMDSPICTVYTFIAFAHCFSIVGRPCLVFVKDDEPHQLYWYHESQKDTLVELMED